jgi:hypothetical protein
MDDVHQPTDARLDYCRCGESWPCQNAAPDDGAAFDEWMRIVDRVMRRRTGGFSTSDFPDYGFRHAFRDAATPQEVVDVILSGERWEDA